MSQYIFILGREPALSVAEIAAVARRESINLEWLEITQSYARVVGELPKNFFDTLAGTVKLAEVLAHVPAKPTPISALVQTVLEQSGADQWHFGFSWYQPAVDRRPVRPPHWLLKVAMELKREARAHDRRARYVVAREPQLSSVVVTKNKLLPPQGCEFIFIPETGGLTVARTLAVQPFEDWSTRDYGRPERDLKVGMLPPKLARLMVNLAAVPRQANIIDPFCGSGTVLQEAALLGYHNLWGTDADPKALERTRTNWAWLAERYPTLGVVPQLNEAAVADVSRRLSNRRFEAVVCEPYLGPPLTGREDPQRLNSIHRELTTFYRSALRALAQLITSGGSLVMVWPVLQSRSGEMPLQLLSYALELGFVVEDQLPAQAPQEIRTPRGTLGYRRPGQHVGRDIVVLRRS